MKAPELNPEIKAAISSQILKRDDRLALKQQQLGTSISVIAEALSLSLAEEEGGNYQCIKLLSDAGRLLCDIYHSETLTRKDLVSINLNKDIRETLSDGTTGQYLFGESLEERLKTAKSLEKSIQELRPVKPKVTKKTVQHLNSKGPSRQTRGARGGYQYKRTPYQRSSNFQRPNQRNPQIGRQNLQQGPPRSTSRFKGERQRL